MTLKNVRQAVYDVVKAGKPEWNVYRNVPSPVVYPAIVVVPSDDTTGVPESMGRNSMKWIIDVYVMVAYNEMETSQDVLDDEISPDIPDSTWALLAENSTLDGKVMDATPTHVMFYGRAQTGEASGAPMIGAQIRLEVREC